MPRETTYGFEAEFDIGATSVMQKLHEWGLARDDHLHGYHCDCESCWWRNGFPFRGQTDSSCSGEIISDVFGSVPARDGQYDSDYPPVVWNMPNTLGFEEFSEYGLMQTLCNAALEVDAEPGMNSGFHVHVGTAGLGVRELSNSFYQFLKWEPVLMRVAAGRWRHMRENNDIVREMMGHPFEILTGENLNARNLAEMQVGEQRRAQLMSEHRQNDRHSNLNIGGNGRRPTWEFRLWNSTRAAWRMHMYCEISKAWMDPEFIDYIEGLTPPQRFRRPSHGISMIVDAAIATGYGDLADHLVRQADYLDTKAADAPELLTIG